MLREARHDDREASLRHDHFDAFSEESRRGFPAGIGGPRRHDDVRRPVDEWSRLPFEPISHFAGQLNPIQGERYAELLGKLEIISDLVAGGSQHVKDL
jgi:hypothetical protein